MPDCGEARAVSVCAMELHLSDQAVFGCLAATKTPISTSA